ncbi:MAG: hypothetical protein CMM02_18165 [Rhodopirellula sp.]|nr:hypothetical protein [Rhodopirellula sp.]
MMTIFLTSSEYKSLDQATEMLMDTIYRSCAAVEGPIPVSGNTRYLRVKPNARLMDRMKSQCVIPSNVKVRIK